jgi:hypothetical protein
MLFIENFLGVINLDCKFCVVGVALYGKHLSVLAGAEPFDLSIVNRKLGLDSPVFNVFCC